MFCDIPVFGSRLVVEDRVSKLEKDKASSDEKMKNLEAENVVLKNEVQTLNEKVASLEAGNVALNEVVQGLVTTNEQLYTSNTMLTSVNEILKKMVNDHEADKKLKSKQVEMLYVVLESKMGTSIDAEFDQVQIQRTEAQRIEREKKAAEEAAKASKEKGKHKIVKYNESQDDKYDDVDEEDDDFRAIDDYKDSDDNDDDDDQGDDGNLQIVKRSCDHQRENVSGATHDEESAGIFTDAIPINFVSADTPDTPKVIYLCHNVEEGEYAHNYSREELMEMLGIDDESFNFEFQRRVSKD
ncbi:hypothetical protein Hanom_Chr02g00136081 [Helianthus anomalus]